MSFCTTATRPPPFFLDRLAEAGSVPQLEQQLARMMEYALQTTGVRWRSDFWDVLLGASPPLPFCASWPLSCKTSERRTDTLPLPCLVSLPARCDALKCPKIAQRVADQRPDHLQPLRFKHLRVLRKLLEGRPLSPPSPTASPPPPSLDTKLSLPPHLGSTLPVPSGERKSFPRPLKLRSDSI